MAYMSGKAGAKKKPEVTGRARALAAPGAAKRSARATAVLSAPAGSPPAKAKKKK